MRRREEEAPVVDVGVRRPLAEAAQVYITHVIAENRKRDGSLQEVERANHAVAEPERGGGELYGHPRLGRERESHVPRGRDGDRARPAAPLVPVHGIVPDDPLFVLQELVEYAGMDNPAQQVMHDDPLIVPAHEALCALEQRRPIKVLGIVNDLGYAVMKANEAEVELR